MRGTLRSLQEASVLRVCAWGNASCNLARVGDIREGQIVCCRDRGAEGKKGGGGLPRIPCEGERKVARGLE